MLGSVRKLTERTAGAGAGARSAMLKKSLFLAMLFALPGIAVLGQTGKGAISGDVRDAAGAALPGAKVELQPQVQPVRSDAQGNFSISDVSPGTYALTVSYVGFSAYTGNVTVAPGQTAKIDAVLQVASRNDDVIVLSNFATCRARKPRDRRRAAGRLRSASRRLRKSNVSAPA